MQKVSKQSLAMLALSILLAISIALTFTFAAAQDTKSATGTITFTGNAALTISGFAGTDEAGTFTINVDSNGVSYVGGESVTLLEDMKFGLATTSAPAYVKVVLSVQGKNIEIGPTAANKAVAVAMSNPAGFDAPLDNAIKTSAKQAAGKTWTLKKVLSFASDVSKYVDEPAGATKVTLTITADTDIANL